MAKAKNTSTTTTKAVKKVVKNKVNKDTKKDIKKEVAKDKTKNVEIGNIVEQDNINTIDYVGMVEELSRVEEKVIFSQDSELSAHIRELLNGVVENISNGDLQPTKLKFKDFVPTSTTTIRHVANDIKLPLRKDRVQIALQHVSTLLAAELSKVASIKD